jgi:hypothetical protein
LSLPGRLGLSWTISVSTEILTSLIQAKSQLTRLSRANADFAAIRAFCDVSRKSKGDNSLQLAKARFLKGKLAYAALIGLRDRLLEKYKNELKPIRHPDVVSEIEEAFPPHLEEPNDSHLFGHL